MGKRRKISKQTKRVASNIVNNRKQVYEGVLKSHHGKDYPVEDLEKMEYRHRLYNKVFKDAKEVQPLVEEASIRRKERAFNKRKKKNK